MPGDGELADELSQGGEDMKDEATARSGGVEVAAGRRTRPPGSLPRHHQADGVGRMLSTPLDRMAWVCLAPTVM